MSSPSTLLPRIQTTPRAQSKVVAVAEARVAAPEVVLDEGVRLTSTVRPAKCTFYSSAPSVL